MGEKSTASTTYEPYFKGRQVMITGGLGFLGSNLARKLVEIGAGRIVLVDALIPEHGANRYNLLGIEDKVEIPNFTGGGVNIQDRKKIVNLLPGINCLFNLAGSVSHIDSKNRPLTDLEMNLRSSVALLEGCREHLTKRKNSDDLKIVFSATRDIYGKVRETDLPVKEDMTIGEPADPQGIHKSAAEFHHLWYAKTFGFNAVSLRLTNTYGPRQQMKDAEHGFLNWFIRQAMENKELQLWGGGVALRDFNYIDDVVEAMLLAMASPKANNQVYNLGCFLRKNGRYEDVTNSVLSVGQAAQIVVKLAKRGSCKNIPYPEDKKAIEPGHVYLDATKIFLDLGWLPKVDFEEGVRKTLDFYDKSKRHYWRT